LRINFYYPAQSLAGDGLDTALAALSSPVLADGIIIHNPEQLYGI
jgi:hypothetical protein